MGADLRVFILIYTPDLKQHPLADTSPDKAPTSTTSSYSNIGHEDAQSQDDKTPEHKASSARSKMFNTLYTQAQALVEKDTMIMPFTTPTGYIHLLRHLGPEIVYLQQTLSGQGGDAISQISGWVGQILLVVKTSAEMTARTGGGIMTQELGLARGWKLLTAFALAKISYGAWVATTEWRRKKGCSCDCKLGGPMLSDVSVGYDGLHCAMTGNCLLPTL